MKKEIVIFAGDYNPYPSPNGVCIKNLVEKWKEKYNITIIAYNQDNGKKYRHEDGIDYIYINTLSNKINNYARSKNDFFSKMLKGMCRLWRGVKTMFSWLRYDGYYYRACVQEIKKLRKQKNIDYIMGVCYPFSSIYAAYKCKEKYGIDYITYILDVYSNAKNLRKVCISKKYFENKDIEVEQKILANAKNNYVSEGFVNASVYQFVLNNDIRHTIVGFPILKREQELGVVSTDSNCQIFYAGTFVKGVREPNAMMKLFDYNIEGIKLKLCTTGEYQDILYNWAKNIDNVEYMGSVERNLAQSMMKESHILLNVANLNSHQIPSKIFEYFQTGKPIVNLYADEHGKKLFENYPLVLNIAQDNVTKRSAEQLKEFCIKNKTQRVPIENVLENYQNYSIEHIQAIMEQTLE